MPHYSLSCMRCNNDLQDTSWPHKFENFLANKLCKNMCQTLTCVGSLYAVDWNKAFARPFGN